MYEKLSKDDRYNNFHTHTFHQRASDVRRKMFFFFLRFSHISTKKIFTPSQKMVVVGGEIWMASVAYSYMNNYSNILSLYLFKIFSNLKLLLLLWKDITIIQLHCCCQIGLFHCLITCNKKRGIKIWRVQIKNLWETLTVSLYDETRVVKSLTFYMEKNLNNH